MKKKVGGNWKRRKCEMINRRWGCGLWLMTLWMSCKDNFVNKMIGVKIVNKVLWLNVKIITKMVVML